MAARRALVVDDSRSAREFLTRVLERYELAVDGVESAEQAIEYLMHHQPDVIFMDHQMPGMDGFQAVQAIKNNPRTATIPIMMYTSQAGELYLSQARALGAIGVLPKQVQHADVSKALEQLRLLDEPKPEGEIATIQAQALPIDIEPTLSSTRERRAPNRPDVPALPADLRAIIEALLAHHGLEMRRVVIDNLESVADRIIGDVRLLMHDQLPPASALSLRGRLANWGPWLGVAGLAAAILFGLQWSQQRSDTVALAEQLAHSQQQLSEMQQTLSALQTADAVAASAAAAPNDVSSGAVDEPDANEMLEPVPFGELPLAGARLERVSALLSRLSAQGFRGVLQVRSIPGRFCMITNSAGIPVLPSDATPYSKCEQIGSSPDDNGSVSPRQSVAFANMVSIARQTAAGKIDVRITAGSADEVATPYPPVNDSLTAGEWNRVAAANNRVELHWQPMR